MTKTLDALLFYYYNKNDDVRVTDLRQGVVWGPNTEETLLHADLVNRFDWEGDDGAVLNRFLVQAAVGHPLTIYGSGGQTRAFIHLRDTVRCISLAIQHPPARKRARQNFQPGDQDAPGADVGRAGRRTDRCRHQALREPAQRSARQQLVIHNKQFLELGLNPNHAE
jgi:UDP-sulfoquinovose synthase